MWPPPSSVFSVLSDLPAAPEDVTHEPAPSTVTVVAFDGEGVVIGAPRMVFDDDANTALGLVVETASGVTVVDEVDDEKSKQRSRT